MDTTYFARENQKNHVEEVDVLDPKKKPKHKMFATFFANLYKNKMENFHERIMNDLTVNKIILQTM